MAVRSTPFSRHCAQTSRIRASSSTRSSSTPARPAIRPRPPCKIAPAARTSSTTSGTRPRRCPCSPRSRRRSPNFGSQDNRPRKSQKKARPLRPGFLYSQLYVRRLVRRRDELRDQALVGLEGLLGEIGVEAGNLLRLGDKGLVGRARELGLHFQHLLHRLHAGELFHIRLGVFERLLCIIAIGGGDRLNAALQG